ncbi:plastocyanin/azurin family copper-binding protein [Halobacteriaceae archaeon SHR40]|uniref:plastocyanin/azurin family copper-binding protein n=1 Tax=Halovenus amylolytica TaxID=2500550 RepID=UPI000FE35821
MNTTQKTAAVAFLVTFVAVVAVGGVVSAVTGGGGNTAELPEVENPQYDADRVSPDATPGTANIQMDSSANGETIVVSVGGGVNERDIEPVVNTLIESGAEVNVVSKGSPQPAIGLIGPGPQPPGVQPPAPQPSGGEEESVLSEELPDADGFLSVGVSSYQDEDLDAITEFIESDGRTLVAVNPQQEFTPSSGYAELYSELGAYTESGYVYNLEENDLNYQRLFAEPAGSSMLTDGVDRVVFDTATPVQAASSDERMEPIDGSVRSTTRAETDLPVLVRDGDVALVGDTGFMTPENTQRADNDVFVGNVAEFLVGGERTSGGTDDGSTDRTEQTNETAEDVVTVEVAPGGENVFEPQVTEIEPGTTVRFEWKSGGHNLVPLRQQPEDHPWNGVEEVQDEGFVHEYTFEEESAHEFTSEPYQDEGMVGVIVVGDPEPP